MKKLFSMVLLLSVTQSYANISCKGAAEFALRDAAAFEKALTQPMSARIATSLMTNEQYRFGDVKAGCGKDDTEGLVEFCAEIDQMINVREDLLKAQLTGTKGQIDLVLMMNTANRNLLRPLCKFEKSAKISFSCEEDAIRVAKENSRNATTLLNVEKLSTKSYLEGYKVTLTNSDRSEKETVDVVMMKSDCSTVSVKVQL